MECKQTGLHSVHVLHKVVIYLRLAFCVWKNLRSSPEPVTHSLIVPVWLHHEDSPDSKFMVYALLHDQPDACFIKQTALDKLGIEGPEVNLKLSTVLAEGEITSQKINGLIVRGVSDNTEISLPRTYSREIIPAKRSQIPRPETARKSGRTLRELLTTLCLTMTTWMSSAPWN